MTLWQLSLLIVIISAHGIYLGCCVDILLFLFRECSKLIELLSFHTAIISVVSQKLQCKKIYTHPR